MKPKQIFKILLDVVMTVLFMVLMAYHVTDNRQHEWIGVILFVLFIFHHILNIKWYAGLFKGKYTAARILLVFLNFLLFAAMVGMMVSGIMLSREVFGFLNLRAGMFGRRLHMTSTTWGYLLMSMHIGMHWGMVVGLVKRKLHPSKKWAGYIAKGIAILISAYGVYALVTRQLIERMFLRVHFAFFDYEEPVLFFFADYMCILILFATIAYYLLKFARKPKNERSIETEPIAESEISADTERTFGSEETDADNQEGEESMQIKIIVGDTELYAILEDNATTRALMEQMPMTLPMRDLYGREMCYRYGENALPTDDLRSDGYEVGDIAYWPPRGSLVILYDQNGEQFERQHIGHIDSGVEVFESTGDADVTFEIVGN